ncbi:MAG: MFS transporter [Dehalococcoidia bacterium]|jgi:MFS family permease|nr:MFS transporter [Dehalococcoidia bacterium]
MREASSRGNPVRATLDYFAEVRRFSRNARLYLSYSLLSGLGTGIWIVMFNLYLLRLGYATTFVGLFWMVDMLFHGMFAFPAGLIGDKIGRRKAFILGTVLSIVARGALLFVRDPETLLLLAAISGMGEGFHAVAGAPFMMENSEPRERPHLFSLSASFGSASLFVGSLSGGFLPLIWAGVISVPDLDPAAARWALVTALPLSLAALLPLGLMRERPVELVQSFKDLFTLRNIVNNDLIVRFTLCAVLSGIAFGITVRFFNLFFNMSHGLDDDQIGVYLAIGSLGSALAILGSPYAMRKWGMARGIMITQLISVPFLLLMAIFASLPVVVLMFVIRSSVYSVSMPLTTQLTMAFVEPKERATTAGLTHTAFDVGGAAGAVVGGGLIVGGEFMTAFSVAAALLAVPAILYYVFFHELETEEREAEEATVTAG